MTKILVACVVLFLSINTTLAHAEASRKPQISEMAELFGLPFCDLRLSALEKRLATMEVRGYPSYKDGVAKYSLGRSGILGLTDATVYYNRSGYVWQTLMFGIVESKEKRQYLGNLLERKYGLPDEGFMNNGIGRPVWLFKEGVSIHLHNTTYNVSVLYLDESPKNRPPSGRIDVEALSHKKQSSDKE